MTGIEPQLFEAFKELFSFGALGVVLAASLGLNLYLLILLVRSYRERLEDHE